MSGFYGLIGATGSLPIRMMGNRTSYSGGPTHEFQVANAVWFGVYPEFARIQVDQRDRLAVVVEADLSNRMELRAEIERRGYRLRSDSDGELILAVYECFGEYGFERLKGDFACAIWDQQHQALLLARDPLGHFPLYFWQDAGLIAFASEYKILLALEQVKATPDCTMIQRLQDAKYLPSDRTLLTDIHGVSPAHCVELRAGSRTVRRFWDPRVDVRSGTQAEFAEQIRRQILTTIERQIRPFDKVGVNLSSGIDSAAVLAAIKQVRPELPVYSFSAGHGSNDADLIGAAQIAQHFGAIHHPIVVDPERLPLVLPDLVWRLEDPIARSELAHNYELAMEASRHVEVVFGGYGSDVLFGGTPKDKLIKLMQWAPPLKTPLTEFYNYTQISREPTSVLGQLLKAGYFRGTERPAPTVLGATSRSETWRLPDQTAETFNTYLLDGVLDTGWAQKDLRLHLTRGLDVRSPFFDLDMVRLAFQIPAPLKIRRWREKHILREAVRPWLPSYALERPKFPHRMSSDLAFSDVLERYARDVLAPDLVRARGFFWPAEVEQLLRRPAHGLYAFGHAMRIWTMLMTELWARVFVDRRGSAPATSLDQSPVAVVIPENGHRVTTMNPLSVSSNVFDETNAWRAHV